MRPVGRKGLVVMWVSLNSSEKGEGVVKTSFAVYPWIIFYWTLVTVYSKCLPCWDWWSEVLGKKMNVGRKHFKEGDFGLNWKWSPSDLAMLFLPITNSQKVEMSGSKSASRRRLLWNWRLIRYQLSMISQRLEPHPWCILSKCNFMPLKAEF